MRREELCLATTLTEVLYMRNRVGDDIEAVQFLTPNSFRDILVGSLATSLITYSLGIVGSWWGRWLLLLAIYYIYTNYGAHSTIRDIDIRRTLACIRGEPLKSQDSLDAE